MAPTERVKEAPISIVLLRLLALLLLFFAFLGFQLVLSLAQGQVRVALAGSEVEEVAEAILGRLGSWGFGSSGPRSLGRQRGVATGCEG